MPKQTALEGHRQHEQVPAHEHAAVVFSKKWAPDADVTLAQYRSAVRAWRGTPINGIKPPKPKRKPKPKPKPKRAPAKPAGGSS